MSAPEFEPVATRPNHPATQAERRGASHDDVVRLAADIREVDHRANDALGELKAEVRALRSETGGDYRLIRDELARIAATLAVLEAVPRDVRDHAIAIAGIQAEARTAGRQSGMLWGGVVSLIVSVLSAVIVALVIGTAG